LRAADSGNPPCDLFGRCAPPACACHACWHHRTQPVSVATGRFASPGRGSVIAVFRRDGVTRTDPRSPELCFFARPPADTGANPRRAVFGSWTADPLRLSAGRAKGFCHGIGRPLSPGRCCAGASISAAAACPPRCDGWISPVAASPHEPAFSTEPGRLPSRTG
jgi:hypothetical protein